MRTTLTDTTSPVISQIAGPVSNSRVLNDSVQFTFQITDTNGIDTVYYKVNDSYGGTLTHTTSNVFTLNAKLPKPGKYNIQIYAQDNSSKKNVKVLTIALNYNTKPKPFSVILPVDGDTNIENTDGVLFKWTDATDIDGDTAIYRLSYGISSQTLTTIETKGDTVRLKNLQGGTTYLWTLLAIIGFDTVNCCAANNTLKFTTRNHPATIIQSLHDTTLSINDSLQLTVAAQDAEGIKEYWWDFNGDGTIDKITSIGSVTFKVPATTGTYKTKVLIIDNKGGQTPVTATITTTNNIPKITLTGSDTVGGLHKQINFHATIKDDGAIKKYEWSVVKTGNASDFQIRSQADTAFFSPDSELPINLTAILRVTDDDGNIATDSLKVAALMRWTKVTESLQLPGYGDDGCIAFFNDSIWYTAGDTIGASSDGKNWCFTKLPSAFASRYNSALTVFKNRLWSINGDDGGTNDIWSTGDGRNWTCDTVQANFPKTMGATVTAFNNKLWLIGGMHAGTETNEIYSSADGKQWNFVINGNFPARYNHTTIVFDNKLWIIGGLGFKNDVWMSTDGSAWEKKILSPVNYKPPFLYSSAVTYGNKMWIIGGQGVPGAWFSQDGNNWTKATTSDGPASCYTLALVADNKNRLWALGGFVLGSGKNQTVWYTTDAP